MSLKLGEVEKIQNIYKEIAMSKKSWAVSLGIIIFSVIALTSCASKKLDTKKCMTFDRKCKARIAHAYRAMNNKNSK